jgi:glutamate---cysteine ligase / carboxylate-amine ligase
MQLADSQKPDVAALLAFAPSEFLSLGVEVEVQLVDHATLNLVEAAEPLLQSLGNDERFKPEILSTMLEFCTGVCPDMATADAQLRAAAARLRVVANAADLHIVGTGTHPFAGLGRRDQVIHGERYAELMDRNALLGLRANCFGLHVHVGVRGPEHAISLINGVSHYLPHLLALSASSPYLDGVDSGLCSSRVTFFEAKPNCGIAPAFACWSDFARTATRMLHSGSIQSLKDLHWDIRPSPAFGTVEVRICDGQASIEDTCVLVALTQWLFAWVNKRLEAGETFAPPSEWRMRENKWRALRWGLEGETVTSEEGDLRSMRAEWLSLLMTLKPIARRLGGLQYLERARQMIHEPGYLHQRRIVEQTGSLRSLVLALAEQWRGSTPVRADHSRLLIARDGGFVTHVRSRRRGLRTAESG